MAHTTDHSPRSTVVALVGSESDALLAGLHGLPALLYDVQCRGSQSYMSLARELIEGEA